MSDCGDLRVDPAAFNRAAAAGEPVGGCRWCDGGQVIPDGPAEEHDGVRWMTARCARCATNYAWPDGKTSGFVQEHRRRAVEPPARKPGLQPFGPPSPGGVL